MPKSTSMWESAIDEIDSTKMTTNEREMTDAEMKERERLVKGMKKGDWSRYGERGKSVMYATATKRAMGEAQVTSALTGKTAAATTAPRTNPQQQLAAASVMASALGADTMTAARTTNPSQKAQLALRAYQNKPGQTPQTDKLAGKLVGAARNMGIDIPDSAIPPRVKNQLTTSVQENHEDDDMHVDVTFDDVSQYDDQEMMTAQLDAIRSRAHELHSLLQHVHIEDVPAWIQDKVSIADHNMAAILDYFQFESRRLDEAETTKMKEVAWFLQPAHMVAKVLGGPGYAPVGVKAEDIVNNAILAFLRASHTAEMWKAAGAALNAVKKTAGVQWDDSLIKPSLQKAMGIESSEVPVPEPEPEPKPEETPKETPKAKPEPAAKELPKAKPEKKEKAETTDEKEPQVAQESVEIEIKLSKPMDKVTFQQKKVAALEFAAATCPGMKPNGVTPEQIINNAVSVWFHRHPVPLDAELKVLGDALEIVSKLGIDWNFQLVPAMYLSALKLPNVKVTEVGEKDASTAGKKIDSLENVLLEL